MRNSLGRPLTMQAPLAKAPDCALHRHLSQLAATHALFLRERGTLQALNEQERFNLAATNRQGAAVLRIIHCRG